MRAGFWVAVLGLLGTTQDASARSVEPGRAPGLTPVKRNALRITEGALGADDGGRMSVDAPKLRAVLQRAPADQDVALDFTFLGPTVEQIALGSGELRQQIALKLRAQDGCNLLYATWRFTPRNAVVVSMKSNPGQHTSAECGNRGYRNLKALESRPPPPISPGAHHVFRARVAGDTLAVFIDGAEVWSGQVPAEAAHLRGPVGMRTDNVRIAFTLLAPGD